MNLHKIPATETQRHGAKHFNRAYGEMFATVSTDSILRYFEKLCVNSSISLCLCGKIILGVVMGLMLCLVVAETALCAEEKWKGIDDAVVGKIAREHGREVKKSLIDTSEGDLQLFVFLAAGTVGGFVAGYYWRVLLEGKKKPGTGDDSV